jgi:hypothetical protein
MKTNYQDPQTSEIRSTQIAGIQEAVGKLEDSVGMESVAEATIELTEVYISAEDRYRIYQAPAGKRNWVASPAPVIKKNGVVVTEGFTIDHAGGAINVSPSALSTDVFTADATYVTAMGTSFKTHLADFATPRNVKNYGVLGVSDGCMDSTVMLNALEGGYTYLFPPDTYMINGVGSYSGYGGWEPKENTKYIFPPLVSKLKIINEETGVHNAIWISDKKGIEFWNLTIEGDRDEHIGTMTQFGYGIQIRENSHVKIYNGYFYNFRGDGIFVSTIAPSVVELYNNVCDNNARQGMSIVRCGTVKGWGNKFSNTNGHAPSAGIDVEPNAVGEKIGIIQLDNTIFEGNAGVGFGIYGGSGDLTEYSINLPHAIFKNNTGAFTCQSLAYSKYGNININEPEIIGGTTGFALNDSQANIRVTNPKLIDNIYPFIFTANAEGHEVSNFKATDVEVSVDDTKLINVLRLYGSYTYKNIDIDITRQDFPAHNKIYNSIVATSEKFHYGTNYTAYPTNHIYTNSIAQYRFCTINNRDFASLMAIQLNEANTTLKNTEITIEVGNAVGINVDAGTKVIYPLGLSIIKSTQLGAKIRLKYDGTQWIIKEKIGDWVAP